MDVLFTRSGQGHVRRSAAQLADVARVCNRYPNIEVSYEIANEDEVEAGDSVEMVVQLEREMEDGELGPVITPRYPKRKDEAWWLVVGDVKKGTLAAIKRVTDLCWLGDFINRPIYQLSKGMKQRVEGIVAHNERRLIDVVNGLGDIPTFEPELVA